MPSPDEPEQDRLSAVHQALFTAVHGHQPLDTPLKAADAETVRNFLQELEAEGYIVVSTHEVPHG